MFFYLMLVKLKFSSSLEFFIGTSPNPTLEANQRSIVFF